MKGYVVFIISVKIIIGLTKGQLSVEVTHDPCSCLEEEKNLQCLVENPTLDSTVWYMGSTQVTSSCTVLTDYVGIIEFTSCSIPSGIFNIKIISIKESDFERWICFHSGLEDYAYLNSSNIFKCANGIDTSQNKNDGDNEEFVLEVNLTSCMSPKPLFRWYNETNEITDIEVYDLTMQNCSDSEFLQGSRYIVDTGMYDCNVSFESCPAFVIHHHSFDTSSGISTTPIAPTPVNYTSSVFEAAMAFDSFAIILGAGKFVILKFIPHLIYANAIQNIVLVLVVVSVIYMILTSVAVALDIAVLFDFPSDEAEWIATIILMIIVIGLFVLVYVLILKETITQPLADFEGTVGDTVMLTCKSNTKEDMVMVFEENKRDGGLPTKVKIEAEIEKYHILFFHQQILKYEIKDVSPRHEGLYNVTRDKLQTAAHVRISGGVNPNIFKSDLKDIPTTEVKTHRKLPKPDYD